MTNVTMQTDPQTQCAVSVHVNLLFLFYSTNVTMQTDPQRQHAVTVQRILLLYLSYMTNATMQTEPRIHCAVSVHISIYFSWFTGFTGLM